MKTEGFDSLLNFAELLQVHKIILLVVSFILLVAFVKLLNKIGKRLQSRLNRHRLLILQVFTILSFVLYIFGGFSLFYAILAPPSELLLAIGGSAAVAIGFSLKDLVGSFVAGIVILLDRPFQVGDRVTFEGIYGEIVSIGLRAVRVNTLTDDLVTIPNSRFFTEAVSSGNAGALDMMVAVNFYIDLEADILRARELLYEIVVTSRYVFLKKPVKITAEEVVAANRLALKLTAKSYVLDVQYEKALQTDIVTRTELSFKENNIKRPALNV